MFKNRLWMPQLAYLVGLGFLITLPWRASATWLPVVVLLYLLLTCVISVGIHRLFCHRSFKTNRFFHGAFAIGSVLPVLGSPIQWSTIHTAHHKHADREGDPHPAAGRWSTLVFRQYRGDPSAMWCSRSLLGDPLHIFVHRYYALLWATFFGLMCALSLDFALNAYLPALGLLQLITSVNVILGHFGGRPRDWPWFEFVMPACGEWSHTAHHRRPGDPRLGRFDLGHFVIRAISTKKLA